MADAEVATNQALRFANALRWERGQRKEADEKLESAQAVRGTLPLCFCKLGSALACRALAAETRRLLTLLVLAAAAAAAAASPTQEVGQARQLNKKLTAELQATSALLNSAAKAAELLQKQKEKSRQLESQLRAASRELESLKERRPGSSELGSDEHEMLLDALQRQQQDAAELRRQLAARDEQIQQLSGGGVQVRSPLKMDPAELLRGQSRERAESGGPDPVIQALWTDDDVESPRAPVRSGSGRAPLGSLDSNAAAPVQLISEGQKRKPQAVRIGRGCTCGGCTIDDAGNFRLMRVHKQSAVVVRCGAVLTDCLWLQVQHRGHRLDRD